MRTNPPPSCFHRARAFPLWIVEFLANQGYWLELDAARARPARLGLPQGGMGHRGSGAGRGPDLSADGAERAGGYRECWAEAGGCNRGADRLVS